MHLLAKLILIAGTAADAASSWHQPELNPVLARRGEFSGSSVAIKGGIVGAQIIVYSLIERKHPQFRNIGDASEIAEGALFASVAVRNWRQR